MGNFRVQITTGSGTPIYRQIVDQVRLGVSTGALPPGHLMPSVRGLAEQLLINVNTVAKAYGELVHQGILKSQAGLGIFVAEKRRIYSRTERLRRLRHAAGVFVHEAVLLDFSSDEIVQAVESSLSELDPRSPKPAGAKP